MLRLKGVKLSNDIYVDARKESLKPFARTNVRMNDVIAHTLLYHDVRTVELEFRIGILGDRRFASCVGETRWNRLRQKLGDGGTQIGTCEKIVKNSDGSNSKYVTGDGEPRWIHKRRIKDDDVQKRPWCMRTSLSLEIEEPGPPPKTWQYVRNKERITYAVAPWKIDITRVLSTPPDDLDREYSYEVEIELADQTEFFSKEIGEILSRGSAVVDDMIAFMTSDD